MNKLLANMLGDGHVALALRDCDVGAYLNTLSTQLDALKTDADRISAQQMAVHGNVFDGQDENEGLAMYSLTSSTAVIPVSGTLINRFGGCWGFVTGYDFIRRAITGAIADDRVQRIVLDIDSNGGEAAGCFELAAFIRSAREQKPIDAMVNSKAFSAAYAIASACGSVTAIPSAGVGSIGVIAVHMSLAKALEDWGVKVSIIRAGERKAEGNPFEDLTDAARKGMQEQVDMLYNSFVSLVVDNRGIDEKAVKDTQAACLDANAALKLGLIDAIASIDTAFQEDEKPKDESEGDTTNDEDTDVDEKEKKAVAEAERSRIAAIVGCEEAKGREELANHIAFKTEMNADDAKAMLAAAPVTQVVVEADDVSLVDLMAKVEQPNVGADTDADVDDIAMYAEFANGEM